MKKNYIKPKSIAVRVDITHMIATSGEHDEDITNVEVMEQEEVFN